MNKKFDRDAAARQPRMMMVLTVVTVGVAAAFAASLVTGKEIVPGAPGGNGGGGTLGTVYSVGYRPEPGPYLSGFLGVWGVPGANYPRPPRDGDLVESNPGQSEEADKPSAKDTCPKSGNPVVLATGNKVETAVDFESEGEMPLTLIRTWNGYAQSRYALFDIWRSNFDRILQYGGCSMLPGQPLCTSNAPQTISMLEADGTYVAYDRAEDGIWYERKAAPIARFVRNADQTWTHYTETGDVEQYNSGGKITKVADTKGVSWTYQYGGENGTLLQRITHSSGRYISFAWTKYFEGNGWRITQVRDPNGNTLTYDYTPDAYRVLEAVTLPGSPSTKKSYHYRYRDLGQALGDRSLTGVSINGARYSTFTYDESRRAVSTEHAGAVEKFSFVYANSSAGEMSVTETNPLGKVATYKFENERLVSIDGKASAHCAASYKETTYDSNGYKDLQADYSGNFVDYDYDSHGHLLKKVEGKGTPVARTTRYTWDEANNRVSAAIVEGYRETKYSYESRGRLERVTEIDRTAVGGSDERVTSYSYTYHSNGLVASMREDGPLSGAQDAIETVYTEQGDVQSITNGLGHKVQLGDYNGYGRPGYLVDENGLRKDFSYDEQGRLVQVKQQPHGTIQMTSYQYDGFGRLAKLTSADGQATSYLYDVAGRLTIESRALEDGSFAQKAYTYNAMSMPTSVALKKAYVDPGQGTVQ